MSPKDELPPIERLTRDLRKASATLGDKEARFLVDAYYLMQDQRKRTANQVRALSSSEEPHAVLNWLTAQSETMEKQVKSALAAYAEAHPVGSRMLNVVGIGPVIAAGLLAHIDIRHGAHREGCDCAREKLSPEELAVFMKARKLKETDLVCYGHRVETAGKIWRFAGQDPTSVWEKGQKRPWNADLKTLCWKIGESFVKTKSREGAFYGLVYDQRKAYETQINANRGYQDQAIAILKSRPNHAQAATYAEGRLPDGHIHARAKRYAVKLFLAHLHEVWFRFEFGIAPPKPYVIEHLGHTDIITPPF